MKVNNMQSAVDIKDKPIIQLGFVVRDAVRMAKRYAEIFGIGPWSFLDGKPRDFILQDETMRNVDCGLRLAMADLGKIQIELIQPLYGPSTHMTFLQEKGEGIHHVSFGAVEGHDQIISGLTSRGIGIDMQGLAGDTDTFTYFATEKQLGTIFEIVNPSIQGTLRPWGTYENPDKSMININGKEIKQIGIVVENLEETVKNYWELLGVGPWRLIDFKSPNMTDVSLYGIPIHNDFRFHTKAAMAQLGDMQIEILEPFKGPSTYMEFLKTRGPGIHHVSFGRIEDHDDRISEFNRMGIEIESTGTVGGAVTFTYLATQQELGTIFEILKDDPDKKNTLTIAGTYPPPDGGDNTQQ